MKKLNERLIPFSSEDLSKQNRPLNKEYEIPAYNPEVEIPITGEIVEKRNAHCKSFRRKDGSMIATVYKDPVHFEKNGVWKEFDNTLISDVSENLGEVYVNTESNVHVKFAKKAKKNKMVQIEKDDFVLSWGIKEAAERSAKTRMASDEESVSFVIQHNPVSVKTARKALVSKALDTQKDIAEYNNEKTTIRKAISKGYYPNVWPNVDIQYVLQGDKIKENIIIKEKAASDTVLCFQIKHNGLSALKCENGTIDFIERGPEKKVVFTYPLPFMIDGKGRISTDVSYQLATVSDNSSVLTIIPNESWLLSDERVYPVIIDPVTETQKTQNDIDDTFVCTKLPNSGQLSAYGSFNVGRNYAEGTCRALIKFKQLPKLDPGDIIYNAVLRVWQYEFSAIGEQSFKIVAYEPTGAWSPDTTWNTMPGTDYVTLDFQEVSTVTVGNTTTYTPKDFNITRLVRKWYDTGINNGIMLRGYEDLSRDAVARFFTSNFDFGVAGMPGGVEQYPTGFFVYKNATGLENYWSYHEQELGRAGKGHVNDFNGNLVYEHLDAQTSGGRAPVMIKHFYNLSESNNASRFGYGWRINGMQRIDSTGITDSPYVYTDEDGTKHYITKENKDEDGMSLEYKSIDEGELKHQLTCKDKTIMKFDVWGYLRRVIDPNGNTIAYNYGPNSAGNFLGNVHDGADKVIEFRYNADMSRLEAIVDVFGRNTSYAYDGSGNLVKITYPDGTFTQFTYEGHKLKKVTAPSGYSIEYSYSNDMQVPRVSKVAEFNGSETGQSIAITYKNGNRTTFESCGKDGKLDTKADNLYTIYQFDNLGRPLNVIDDDGNAAAYAYYSSNMNNNKLNTSGKTQATAHNLIQNPCFENVSDSWHFYALASGLSYGVDRVSDCGFMDKRSIKVTKSTANSMAGAAQDVDILSKYVSFTLSAYVKTQNIIEGSGSNAGAVLMVVKINDDGTNKIIKTSKPVVGTTDSNINDGWVRIQTDFVADTTTGTKFKIMGGVNNATGTAWFDGFQIDKGVRISNKLNLINNPSFELAGDSDMSPKYWGGGETSDKDGRIKYSNNPDTSNPSNKDGAYCLRIGGEFGRRKSFSQAINVSGEQGDVFHLSCRVSANPIPGKEFRISAAVLYESGDPKWTNFDFTPYSTEWQYVGGVVSTDDGIPGSTRKYTAIHIYIFFADTNNYAFFDSVQLIKDNGQSYVYDSNGELVSSKNASKASHFTYDGNANITRMVNPDGSAFEYANDSKNNLKLARNAQGVVTRFKHDAVGNPIESKMEHTRNSGSVVPGRVYFIRQKTSGKYLDVSGGTDTNNTNVWQYTYNGSVSQKWKVIDGKEGYIMLQPLCSSTRVLDITNAQDADGANAAIYDRNNSNAQRFKLKVVSDGSYQIAAKCTNDKRVLTNQGGHTESGTNIDIRGIVDEHPDQSWYFELADLDLPLSDAPTMNKSYFIRIRHDGQYWDVNNIGTDNGTLVVQSHLNGGDNQRFRLEAVPNEAGYFYIHPLHIESKVLQIGADNKMSLADKTNDDRKKFKFTLNSNGTYRVNMKADNGGLNTLGVAGGSYAIGTNLDVFNDQGAETQQFLMEEISDVVRSKVTYTDDQSQVKTMTDPNGNTVTYNYDEKNQYFTSVAETGGKLTERFYNTESQNLERVRTKIDEKTFDEVQFAYDKDTLTKITHNGFDYTFEYDGLGNMTKVNLGGQMYLVNAYEKGVGNLSRTYYANFQDVLNFTDKYQRVIWQSNTPGRCIFNAFYDSMGNLVKDEDGNTGRLYEYEYDITGRLIEIKRSGPTIKNQRLALSYDKYNRVNYLVNKVDDRVFKTQYVFGNPELKQLPDLISEIKVNDISKVSYSYDDLARGLKRTLKTATPFVTTYQMKEGDGAGLTTSKVKSVTNGASTLSYTYDVAGNILTVSENGVLKITYTYDLRNQLKEETNHYIGKNISYQYDVGGNLLKKTSSPLSDPTASTFINYEYDTVWKDKLVKYNGQAITYDANGNPLTYYNGMTLHWDKGRELGSVTIGGKTTSYQYMTDGSRIEKSTDGVTTHFYLNGQSIVTQMTDSGDRLDFYYDETSRLFGFNYNNSDYYYVRNVQNDIISIVDASGNIVVNYLYDSWGKLISMTGSLKDTIGVKNPFRYRGYYYDNETGFYYLQSRYYDPEVGRFINPDIIMGVNDRDPLAYNLFVYCGNNPVNREDPSGRWWKQFTNWVGEKVHQAQQWIGGIIQSVQNFFQPIRNPQPHYTGSSTGNYTRPDIGNDPLFMSTFVYSLDESWDVAKSIKNSSAPVIRNYSIASATKVGVYGAFFFGNDIYQNYETYGNTNNKTFNITVANAIDVGVLALGTLGTAFAASFGLPVVALGITAIGLGWALSLAGQGIEDMVMKD